MSQAVYLDAGSYNISFLAAQRADSSQTHYQEIEVLVDGAAGGRGDPRRHPVPLLPDVEFHGRGRDAHHRVRGHEPAGRRQHRLRRPGGHLAGGELDQRRQFRDAGVGREDLPVAPNGSPWQFSGKAGVSSNGSAFTGGNPNAPDGTQVAFIKNTGSMSQSVYLDAGTYSLSFLAAQRGSYQTQNQQIQVLVDGAKWV